MWPALSNGKSEESEYLALDATKMSLIELEKNYYV